MTASIARGLFAGLALLLVHFVPMGVYAQDAPSEVVVVGDSLSDAGNLAAVPGFEFLMFPPFDNGLSNGPRAVEVLAAELGTAADPSLHLVAPFPVGTNFAVAGARAVTLGLPPTIDLPTQLGVLLASRGGVLSADGLYVVFIGGNDVRDARDAGNKKIARAIVDEAVAGTEEVIRALVAAGAGTVLVANVPDIGGIPETRALGGPAFAAQASRLSKRFNNRLRKAVHDVEKDFDVDIVEFDTFRFLRLLIRDAAALGFTNVSDACFKTSEGTFHPDCLFGANFDSFVFFDEIHPTARVHALAADAMLEALAESAD